MAKSNANYEIFNVGSGKPISFEVLRETLARLYKKNIRPSIENKFQNGGIRYYFGNISKIKDKLGYASQTILRPECGYLSNEGAAICEGWISRCLRRIIAERGSRR